MYRWLCTSMSILMIFSSVRADLLWLLEMIRRDAIWLLLSAAAKFDDLVDEKV
jgi:hypothetical protein